MVYSHLDAFQAPSTQYPNSILLSSFPIISLTHSIYMMRKALGDITLTSITRLETTIAPAQSVEGIEMVCVKYDSDIRKKRSC